MSPISLKPQSFLPVWIGQYDRKKLADDAIAAIIVTIMLVPQSLAYALLVGLPPQAGIYASIVPIILYALIGSSSTLAVGPVAVVSLMTATAIGDLAEQGTAGYATAALSLALLSGVILLVLGLFRGGFLANFLSHPVITGFITASGLLIAVSQIKHIFGVSAHGETLPVLLQSLWMELQAINVPTLLIGLGGIAWLSWSRFGLGRLLAKVGLSGSLGDILRKSAPLIAIIVAITVTSTLSLADKGVSIVGEIPTGLPPFTLPSFDMALLSKLFFPAFLISIIGFVESASVAQTLAAKRQERVLPNRELLGLGAANVGAAFTGGFPVTGGFSRSVVNFDAGARTPAAGILTAVGLAICAMFLTPLLYFLPKAILAATIIVAVLSLVEFQTLKETWRYSKADFAAVSMTILVTLLLGVEAGVSTGVALSILILLFKSSRPHIAVVGRVPGTEHFRNVLRHKVLIDERLLIVRVDESLYFANARYLEDHIDKLIAERPQVQHVVLMCIAVNAIDTSALHSLETINQRLKDRGITFHLSEVKGPVMDRLKRTHFPGHLTGNIFLSQQQAISSILPDGCKTLTGPDEASP